MMRIYSCNFSENVSYESKLNFNNVKLIMDNVRL